MELRIHFLACLWFQTGTIRPAMTEALLWSSLPGPHLCKLQPPILIVLWFTPLNVRWLAFRVVAYICILSHTAKIILTDLVLLRSNGIICLISPVVCPAAAVQIVGRMPRRPRLDWRVYSSRSCAKICSWPKNCAVNEWSCHLVFALQLSRNTELLIAMGGGVWEKLLFMPHAACTTNKVTVKNGDTWININYLDISWHLVCL